MTSVLLTRGEGNTESDTQGRTAYEGVGTTESHVSRSQAIPNIAGNTKKAWNPRRFPRIFEVGAWPG